MKSLVWAVIGMIAGGPLVWCGTILIAPEMSIDAAWGLFELGLVVGGILGFAASKLFRGRTVGTEPSMRRTK